jgi:nitroreductase
LFNLLKQRRSIRKYSNKKIEKEKIQKLIQGALLSPSSRGLKPWEFILVEDSSILEKLSHSKPGAAFLKNAQLGIVILGNSEKCDVWIEDTSIASTIIHLLSTDLGLGSCWIQIRERNYDEATSAEEYIRQVLSIPDNIRVLSIISMGYPDETKPAYTEESLSYEKVYLNAYGDQYLK